MMTTSTRILVAVSYFVAFAWGLIVGAVETPLAIATALIMLALVVGVTFWWMQGLVDWAQAKGAADQARKAVDEYARTLHTRAKTPSA